ncbi:MAG TPA: ABC transporter substrate-binding protein [Polyangiaceae bacterium]|nr:ABC transporter substrate-binding protein [Polyangiaceae bacterium]
MAARFLAGLLAFLCLVTCSRSVPLTESSKSGTRVQVRFWHMWTAEWKTVVDRIVERYNQSQDQYEVVALSVPPTGAESKFLLAVVGGDPPDVMAQWQNVIPTWADSGLILPLDDLMSPADRTTFARDAYPVVKKIGTYRGHLYGLAIGVNTWACYVRLDHLEQAGLDPAAPPTTLEGLVGWGRRLDSFDRQGNLTRLGFLPQWLLLYAPLFGGGFYDEATGRLTLDSAENQRALAYSVEQRQKLGIDRVTRFDSAQNAGFGVEWPFAAGSLSMTVDGQWRVEQLAKYAPGLKYKVVPVPPPQGGQQGAGYANGNFMIVPRGAKQARGAWEFIRFWSGLADPAAAAELYTWGGWLPALPAVASAPAYQRYLERFPQFRTFLELMPSEHLVTVPPVPFQTYLLDRIEAADQAAARGALTPAAALQRLSGEIDEERARRKELGYER